MAGFIAFDASDGNPYVTAAVTGCVSLGVGEALSGRTTEDILGGCAGGLEQGWSGVTTPTIIFLVIGFVTGCTAAVLRRIQGPPGSEGSDRGDGTALKP